MPDEPNPPEVPEWPTLPPHRDEEGDAHVYVVFSDAGSPRRPTMVMRDPGPANRHSPDGSPPLKLPYYDGVPRPLPDEAPAVREYTLYAEGPGELVSCVSDAQLDHFMDHPSRGRPVATFRAAGHEGARMVFDALRPLRLHAVPAAGNSSLTRNPDNLLTSEQEMVLRDDLEKGSKNVALSLLYSVAEACSEFDGDLLGPDVQGVLAKWFTFRGGAARPFIHTPEPLGEPTEAAPVPDSPGWPPETLCVMVYRGLKQVNSLHFNRKGSRTISVGRVLGSDVHLPDDDVKRLHAVIQLGERSCHLCAFAETEVSGVKLYARQSSRLVAGDTITVGPFSIMVCAWEEEPDPKTFPPRLRERVFSSEVDGMVLEVRPAKGVWTVELERRVLFESLSFGGAMSFACGVEEGLRDGARPAQPTPDTNVSPTPDTNVSPTPDTNVSPMGDGYPVPPGDWHSVEYFRFSVPFHTVRELVAVPHVSSDGTVVGFMMGLAVPRGQD